MAESRIALVLEDSLESVFELDTDELLSVSLLESVNEDVIEFELDISFFVSYKLIAVEFDFISLEINLILSLIYLYFKLVFSNQII